MSYCNQDQCNNEKYIFESYSTWILVFQVSHLDKGDWNYISQSNCVFIKRKCCNKYYCYFLLMFDTKLFHARAVLIPLFFITSATIDGLLKLFCFWRGIKQCRQRIGEERLNDMFEWRGSTMKKMIELQTNLGGEKGEAQDMIWITFKCRASQFIGSIRGPVVGSNCVSGGAHSGGAVSSGHRHH